MELSKSKWIHTSIFHEIICERLKIAGKFVLIHQFVEVEIWNDDIFRVSSNVNNLRVAINR